MEQGPHLFYERDSGKELPPNQLNSPERLLPPAEKPKNNPEALSASKTFEQLVKEALAEELKFERDPALRDQAAKRADEILAEFQEAKNLPENNGGQKSSADGESRGGLTPELAKQLGIKQQAKPAQPVYPGTGLSFGLADLVMAAIIGVLLIIIILLLIF